MGGGWTSEDLAPPPPHPGASSHAGLLASPRCLSPSSSEPLPRLCPAFHLALLSRASGTWLRTGGCGRCSQVASVERGNARVSVHRGGLVPLVGLVQYACGNRRARVYLRARPCRHVGMRACVRGVAAWRGCVRLAKLTCSVHICVSCMCMFTRTFARARVCAWSSAHTYM